MERKYVKNSQRYSYRKSVQEVRSKLTRGNHVRAFSHKLFAHHLKRTLCKRVSGGLLLSMFQKRVRT